MFQTDFGGSAILPYLLLGISLLVGYTIWMVLRHKKARARRRSRLEDELQAEIHRYEEALHESGSVRKTDEEAGALEPPPEVQRQMEEIRRQAGQYQERE